MTDTIPGVVALSDTDIRVHRLLGPSTPPSEARGFTALVPVAGIDNSMRSFVKRLAGFGATEDGKPQEPIVDYSQRTRWLFRVYGAALRRLPLVRDRYGLILGTDEDQFFYSVRWSLVDNLAVRRELSARPDDPRRGQGVERLTWLLFESNYTGDLDDYVEAFLDTLPTGLLLHFGTSLGYPTTADRQLFLAWLSRWLIPVDFYWARDDFRVDLVTFRQRRPKVTIVPKHRWSSYLLPVDPEASTIQLRDVLDDFRANHAFPFRFDQVPQVHHGRTALLPSETWTSMHSPGSSFDRSCNLLLSFSHSRKRGRDVLEQLLPESLSPSPSQGPSLDSLQPFFAFDLSDPAAVSQYETGRDGGQLTLITYDVGAQG